jgi:hypothetical protein
MTVEQLAVDYKQLMAVTTSLAAALQSIDIFEKYPEGTDRRWWSNHNCWLYKGEAIANVNAAYIEKSVESFKLLMYTIDSNQELKMLLQGIEINKINEPHIQDETPNRYDDIYQQSG